MKATLKFLTNGTVQEHTINLGEIASIGRSSKCEFQLSDDKCSSRHCRFFLKKDRLEITDLDSKNGTYLNGIRIESSEVFLGDEIKIGDTLITIEEKTSDAEALNTLTFPGPKKDRISYELKADFTGARMANQMNNKKLSVVPKVNYDASRIREIDLRKKAQSRLKVSKEEIKNRNQFRSFVAGVFDLVFLAIFLIIPLPFMHSIPESLKAQKSIVVVVVEVFFAAIFLGINFKASKFSFGERLTGIKKLYTNQ